MDDCFDLSILDTGRLSRALAIARCGYDLAIEPLSCTKLRKLMDFRARLASAIDGTGQRPTNSELSAFGQKLFNSIIQGKVKKIYDRLPHSHIRLQIYSDLSDLQALPWEYMRESAQSAAPDVLRSIVRIVPTIGVSVPRPLKLTQRKLQLLFVQSEPIDQGPVEWDQIKQAIESDFKVLPDSLKMTIVQAATRQSLLDALDGKRFDIFHFAGHGEVAPDGTGQLLLRDLKTRKSDPVPARELAPILIDRGLRFVMLSACNTSAGDFTREFAVVAKSLVEAGISAVVANQFPVNNTVAAAFARAFYNDLLRNGDLDLATTNGRKELAFNKASLANDVARFEWGIPTLYRHAGATKVIRPIKVHDL
ncbi:MAG TPA: CHAT domain-containing protein [Anaerolineales bacterium]|nr:CHAT domain-containing protein [Anaerolineales bacterium]